MVVTNEELLKEFPSGVLIKVAVKDGVNSRHIAMKDETATDLAEKAAASCLKSLVLVLRRLILFYFVHRVPTIICLHRHVSFKTD